MNYDFLTKKNDIVEKSRKDYSFLSSKPKSPSKVATLPEHLGGGSYLIGKPNELIKEERSYANLPIRKGMERDHIISVGLGGTSRIENIEYKPTTREGRQQGKVKVEQKAINDYLSGKITLNQARLKIATKQQQIKGLTPTEREQTWQGQIGNVIRDAANNFVDKLIKPKKGEGFEDSILYKQTYNRKAEIASKALDKDIKPEEYDEFIKTISPEEEQLIRAVGYETSIEEAARIITAPVRFTAGALATAVVSYSLEKADNNGVFTPKTEAEKLLIGEGDIRRLLNQEDLYGTIARGAGVPVALMSIAVIENPFLAGTGIKSILTNAIKKRTQKNLSKVGIRTIINIADDVIKAEAKAGKVEQEVAEKALSNIKKTKINFSIDTPKVKPIDNVINKSTKVTSKNIKKIQGLSEKLKSGKKVKSGQLEYLPNERPIDLRRKITTERLLFEPSVPTRIKDEAIEKGLKADFSGIEDYTKVSFKDQAKLVGDIIDDNPVRAINIALGKELPTNGALPESVFTAVKNQAIKNGDADLLVRLATEEGGVAKESTVLGQRIKMLDDRLEIDPFKNINEVVRTREKIAKKRYKSISKAKKETVNNIKKSIPKAKVDEWTAFIKEITCK